MLEFIKSITLEGVFLAPGEFFYWFFMGIFRLNGFGWGIDLVCVVIISTIFYAYVGKGLFAVLKRVTGFE